MKNLFVLVYHSCYDRFLTDDPYRIYPEEDYIQNRNNSYTFILCGSHEECRLEHNRLMASRFAEYDYQEMMSKEMSAEF